MKATRRFGDQFCLVADLDVDRIGHTLFIKHLLDGAQRLVGLVAVVGIAIFPADERRDMPGKGRLYIQQMNIHPRAIPEPVDDVPDREMRVAGAVDWNEYF